jgi:hypothetical protein
MNRRAPLIVVAHCTLLMGGAYAADRIASATKAAAPTEFATLDADQNGMLTRDEVRADATLQAAAPGVDTDGDLLISRDEHAAWSRELRAGATPANHAR